jgi:hypothetical protein
MHRLRGTEPGLPGWPGLHTGWWGLEILNGSSEANRTVLELADAEVATGAQEPADIAGCMIVVNDEAKGASTTLPGPSAVLGPADGALATLASEDGTELLRGQIELV